MNINNFYKLLKSREIKILMLDYFGPIDFTLIFSDITTKKMMLYIMHILNQFIGYSSFVIPKCKYLSPYMILIAKKIDWRDDNSAKR